MSPASFIHSLLKGRLTKLFGNQLEDDVFTDLAVQNTKGYVQKHIKDVYALSALELYIEIISPSKMREEMKDKVKFLYWLTNGSILGILLLIELRK